MGIEGHCVLALSSVDAGNGEDGRLSSGMEDPRAKSSSSRVVKEGKEDVAGVLVGEDADDFVRPELEQDLAGGLTSRNNLGAGFAADVVDNTVNAFVIGVAGDDMERVSGEAHPGGDAFPIAEVSGDEESAFSGIHSGIEVFSTNNFCG